MGMSSVNTTQNQIISLVFSWIFQNIYLYYDPISKIDSSMMSYMNNVHKNSILLEAVGRFMMWTSILTNQCDACTWNYIFTRIGDSDVILKYIETFNERAERIIPVIVSLLDCQKYNTYVQSSRNAWSVSEFSDQRIWWYLGEYKNFNFNF